MKFVASRQDFSQFDDQNAQEKSEGVRPIRIHKNFNGLWSQGTRSFFYYQPIVNAKNGKRITGCEALLRTHRMNGSTSVPTDFLNRLYYDDRDKIVEFDKFVFKRNLDFLYDLHEINIKTKISINISGLFFTIGDGPAAFIEEYLESKKAQHLMRYVDIEVVEWVDFQPSKTVIRNVERCREKGMGICLDDAGTGSVGLDIFISLPFSTLKIDRIFIQRMLSEQRAEYIVRNFAKTAHDLGLDIVAEGVETENQKNMLLDMGIERMQGFYFYTPMSSEAFISVFRGSV